MLLGWMHRTAPDASPAGAVRCGAAAPRVRSGAKSSRWTGRMAGLLSREHIMPPPDATTRLFPETLRRPERGGGQCPTCHHQPLEDHVRIDEPQLDDMAACRCDLDPSPADADRVRHRAAPARLVLAGEQV